MSAPVASRRKADSASAIGLGTQVFEADHHVELHAFEHRLDLVGVHVWAAERAGVGIGGIADH